jgi:hypothetical protein
MPDDQLNAAVRDLVEAGSRLARLGLGTSVLLSVHHCAEEPFFAVDFLGSTFDNENGDPTYGHVRGHGNGYLARRIFRGDNVGLELFMDTPTRREGNTYVA